MTWDANETPYWSQDSSELAAALESGPDGLSSDRAAARLLSVGPNSVEDASHLSALRLLLRQFESPLVLILIFAAAISLVLQQWVDAAIILAIVLGSTLLSFFQEYRASTAVEELKKRLALTCRVVRDGVEQTVPVSTIVPGDLILLSAGNLIPADGLVIEAQDFLVSEASMTGESFPVEKRPGIVRPDAPITARTNAVFLGASVRSGTAKVLAVENRSPDRVRRDRGTAESPPARDGLRARRAPVRISPDPRDGRHRPVRPDGESASRSPGDRVPAVCRGARGRSVAGAACRRSSA